MSEFSLEIIPIPAGLSSEKDVYVEMRDGVKIAVNVYKPDKPGKFPVIMSFSPYGKDETPQVWGARIQGFVKSGLVPGNFRLSQLTPFEAPDPAYWVPAGYALVYVDVRGWGKSGGQRGHLREWNKAETQDYYDLIEWAGRQSWSNGNVGLSGVSYLAIAQYYAASTNPPHLKAICPWEGFSDAYRDTCFPGGIPETNFHVYWESRYMGKNFEEAALARYTDPVANQSIIKNAPELEKIKVPALICATWSDQGLHSRGGFEAFRRIASKEKWLYTHGRKKWEEYYSEEGLDWQKRFYDYFLKGVDSGMMSVPRVRLEIRESIGEFKVRQEGEFPIARTVYKKLYLDADGGKLVYNTMKQEDKVSYSPAGRGVLFDIKFNEDTELSGYMKVKLWVASAETDDMDIFVGVTKLDDGGKDVYFYGMNGYMKTIAARGWLRVSQREVDKKMTTPYQPFLKHHGEQIIKAGEVVPVEVAILPSSTLFRKGEKLRLVLQGRDMVEHPLMQYTRVINKGKHLIYTGGKYDSYLQVPVIPKSI